MWYWIFIAAALFLCYLGTWYAFPARSEPRDEPLVLTCETKFGRSFIIALMLFILFDAALFHSGLYNSIFAPKGAAGTVVLYAEHEANRRSSGKKEILVLGDSRFARGFSAKLANELTAKTDFQFVSLAIPAANPRLWFLLLREVDPSASRYYAIIIPRVFDDVHMVGNLADKTRDIPMAGPLLRYTDAFSFSSSFQERENRYRAFIACLLRGSAIQADLFDFLQHPGRRLKAVQERAAILKAHYEFAGGKKNVIGLSYDQATKRLTFPSRFSRLQKDAIKESIAEPKWDAPKPRRDWTERILKRYANSPTRLISVPVARGPLGSATRATGYSQNVAEQLMLNSRDVVIGDDLFNFMETPEFYSDGFHPNAKGCRKITERMVTELTTRLSFTAPDSPAAAVRSDGHVALSPTPTP